MTIETEDTQLDLKLGDDDEILAVVNDPEDILHM